MKEKLVNARSLALPALTTTLILASNASAALDAAMTDALDEAKTNVLLAIAAGGVVMLAIAGAGLGWRVIGKYIKRSGGAA
jgi:hypothetical protein